MAAGQTPEALTVAGPDHLLCIVGSLGPCKTDKSIDEFPRYPDITVDNPIGLDWSRSDPQADTAITALLEQIDEER